MKDALSDSQDVKNASKVAKRCYAKLKSGDLDGVLKKKFHSLGGGRKSRAGEV